MKNVFIYFLRQLVRIELHIGVTNNYIIHFMLIKTLSFSLIHSIETKSGKRL